MDSLPAEVPGKPKSGERGIANPNPPEFDGVETLSLFKTLVHTSSRKPSRTCHSSLPLTPPQDRTHWGFGISVARLVGHSQSLTHLSPQLCLVSLEQGLCLIRQLLAYSKHGVDPPELDVNAGT